MQNPASKPRNSRFALLFGGVLVVASALVLSRWASGQSSTLRLASAEEESNAAAPAPSQAGPPAAPTSASPTGRYGEAAAAVPHSATPTGPVVASPAANGATVATPSAAQPLATPTQQNVAAQPNSTTAITLRSVPAGEFRQRLEKALGKPLAARIDASGQWETFTPQAGSGAAVMMAVNGRSGEVRIAGPAKEVANWRSIVEGLDTPPPADGVVTQLVSTNPAHEPYVRRALGAIQLGTAAVQGTAALATMFFPQQPGGAGQPLPAPGGAVQLGDGQATVEGVQIPGTPPALQQLSEAGLLGPVQITFIEGANIVLIRGLQADVDRVVRIIQQIEDITKTTTPEVRTYELQHVNSVSMAALLNRVYTASFADRLGPLSVYALGKPNALLLVGATSNVDLAIERIVKPLDQPVSPQTQFQVFRLRHIKAEDAKTAVDAYLRQADTDPDPDEEIPVGRPGLQPRAIVVIDTQTNSLIISASQREIADIAELLRRIDAPSGDAVDVVRVFPLQYAVAVDLADALTTALEPADADDAANRSQALQITPEGAQAIRSGLLVGVRFTADEGSNSLIVTAREETMPLIAALIRALDVPTRFQAAVKVFRLTYGDALVISQTLQTLMAPPAAAGAGAQAGGLVPLLITYDQQSNSIVAAGVLEDLATVQALLVSLDIPDRRQRKTRVYRLKYALATNVATALSTALNNELTVVSSTAVSTYEIYDKAAFVVAEPLSNNVIISATPQYFDEILQLIEDIDKRPPMVMVQVLIAEVALSDRDEFGVELGIQDSVLFDRSGGMPPSFNFLNPGLLVDPLGNVVDAMTTATASHVAPQAVTNFNVGRVGAEGLGGFVFAANSKSVNFLLRALQAKTRVEILSRPQIQTLDAQQAIINVGQIIYIPSTTTTGAGGVTQTGVTQQNVGIELSVTPYIGPDGTVVMTVSITNSSLSEDTTTVQGDELPIINNTNAFTNVSAQSGQTIVLSGLITTRKADIHRRVPLVADIPLIGDLFRYDIVDEERRELLIILTPQVVYTPEDGERLKQIESSRMSWILRDVMALHGDAGLRSRCDEWYDDEVDSMYPGGMPVNGQIMPMSDGEMLPSGGPGIQRPYIQPTPMGMPPSGAPVVPMPPVGDGASIRRAPAVPTTASSRYDEVRQAAANGGQGTAAAPPLRLPTID